MFIRSGQIDRLACTDGVATKGLAPAACCGASLIIYPLQKFASAPELDSDCVLAPEAAWDDFLPAHTLGRATMLTQRYIAVWFVVSMPVEIAWQRARIC